MAKRQGNRPDRRIEAAGAVPDAALYQLVNRVEYEGSPHHKLSPGDYGFSPPMSPRPSKSVCDGLRQLTKPEATTLFRAGIAKGMISTLGSDGLPKYVWAVDATGEAYEAKRSRATSNAFHGYRLYDSDPQRAVVLSEWKER